MTSKGLKRQALSIVNKSQDLIVIGVYKNLIKSHNEFCDCDYCHILKQYVSLKKSFPRLNQRVFEYDDDNAYELLKNRKQLTIELKKQKDALKVKAIQELS